MPGVTLDGRRMSAEIRQELSLRITALSEKDIVPTLAGIIVGDDAGSASYVRLKEKAAAEVGLRSEMSRLPQDFTQKDLLTRIADLNDRDDIHGIFVQLPLPKQFDEERILAAVSPSKDVDGFHPQNVGRAWLGQEAFVPATPAAIMETLRRAGYHDLRNLHAVVVNADNLVGKPIASCLCQPNVGATVTLCDPDAPDLQSLTRQADILVVSVNRPGFITADMVKDGVIAFDFGSNYVDDSAATQGYRLVGDIDFAAVIEKAAAVTPVPGGLGPMTITMLLAHTVAVAERQSATG
ncbi:MAG: bifunctional 5,10-methylenetetrahydrofolate dehydrogenase/5,10-methenyltetrahydrofolate cyclohydrolase [Dehalococcoidia bacterium]|nr:bifunctional 5,10-methylenetetrahydrofolate dehydrogenase/5,10-methenyltetrahydrofolate cyclohydrolase [Dehalococcoidia bacterium]